jgi:hypothetical protein
MPKYNLPAVFVVFCFSATGLLKIGIFDFDFLMYKNIILVMLVVKNEAGENTEV